MTGTANQVPQLWLASIQVGCQSAIRARLQVNIDNTNIQDDGYVIVTKSFREFNRFILLLLLLLWWRYHKIMLQDHLTML